MAAEYHPPCATRCHCYRVHGFGHVLPLPCAWVWSRATSTACMGLVPCYLYRVHGFGPVLPLPRAHGWSPPPRCRTNHAHRLPYGLPHSQDQSLGHLSPPHAHLSSTEVRTTHYPLTPHCDRHSWQRLPPDNTSTANGDADALAGDANGYTFHPAQIRTPLRHQESACRSHSNHIAIT